MNYGFVIRNDRCIGCHACTTACKSENDVPVGVDRTWVKNVEKGRYPNVTRHFQVTRCNHCADPPCVSICPVTAMYQRADGIVEFDPDQCIGCKACLQACPYDAIYIDPESGTAAKCHYCAHRVDLGLEPACVVVCPEHAILAGDLDDPRSEISHTLAKHQVTVRKPEQGTRPKLFYVDGEEVALHPAATERTPPSFAWADVVPLHGPDRTADGGPGGIQGGARADAGTGVRASQPGGRSAGGPIHIGEGPMASEMVRNVYNAQHRVPWHWPVPAYLVTKGMAAGLFMMLALGPLLGLFDFSPAPYLVGGALTLLLTGVTTGLLVLDLERPERFLRVLTRPQWGSWLVRGAYLLVAFTLLVGSWWVLEAGAWAGWWGAGPVDAVRPWIFAAGVPLAAGVAVYTGYLFGQAEGRDLWQGPLLPVHLLVQAFLAGSATLLWVAPFLDVSGPLERVAVTTFVVALVTDLVVMLLGEFGMPHANDAAARAAHEIVRGRYALRFWGMVLGAGHLLPLALVAAGGPAALSVAGVLVLVGLWFYEHAFVMAPQEMPNS